MKTKIATLFEYKKYSFKIGNNNGFIDNEIVLTERTFEVLSALNENKRFLDISYKTIKPRNFVGVVKIEDFTIQIFPKLFKDNLEDHSDIVARNVLKMLSHTDVLPIKDINESDLLTEELDFFEIFINIFAKNLLPLLKDNHHRNYVQKSDNLHFVRGKINTNVCGDPAKLHIIPCTFHEFSIDTMLNRTLKYTTYLMSKKVESIENFQLLREIISIFEDVNLEPITIDRINTISFTRLNNHFKPFVDICKVFLRNSTFSLQASEIDTFALMIPMEKLFESFITNVLQKNKAYFFDSNVSILIQQKIGHLATMSKEKHFGLIPDILIENSNEKHIVDTKYKLLDKEDKKLGISQQDIYQMYAYATKSNAASITLLYPDLEESIDKAWYFDYNEGRNRTKLFVKSVNLSYDLCDEIEWGIFKEKLKYLLSPLRENTESLVITI